MNAPRICLPPPRPSVALRLGDSICIDVSERALLAGASLPDRIAATLAAPDTRALLAALTDGPIRWRLDFTEGGHRRGAVWQTAQAVRALAPELVNDPTRTTWEVVVDEAADRLELRPRSLPDPRFAWRVADVSAASHPTIAAAIARVAGGDPHDVVWDPFCGSGSELVERGRFGALRLCGSDLDSRALGAARANLDAAGLSAELVLADALTHDPGGVTAIVTNPPLGRRLRGDPGALLERFVAHAARVLEPGGRLVWITPVATRTERAARRAGLRLDDRRSVDLGGYDADLERWLR
jgi:predicted RNA methylase